MKTEEHLLVITRSNTGSPGNSHEQKGNDGVRPESHFALDFHGFVCKGALCTRVTWKRNALIRCTECPALYIKTAIQ
jgi:hypothetical protein